MFEISGSSAIVRFRLPVVSTCIVRVERREHFRVTADINTNRQYPLVRLKTSHNFETTQKMQLVTLERDFKGWNHGRGKVPSPLDAAGVPLHEWQYSVDYLEALILSQRKTKNVSEILAMIGLRIFVGLAVFGVLWVFFFWDQSLKYLFFFWSIAALLVSASLSLFSKLDVTTGQFLADPLPSVDLAAFLEHERYAYGKYGIMVRPTLQKRSGYCGLDFYSAGTRGGDDDHPASTDSTSRNDPVSDYA